MTAKQENNMASIVKIDSAVHQQVKIKAAQKGIKIQEWYDAVVRRALGLAKNKTNQPG